MLRRFPYGCCSAWRVRLRANPTWRAASPFRHVAEMAGNKEDAMFVADGFSTHVRQLIEQSYAAGVPWPAEERS
jgi:hypothetical protein